MFFHAETGSVFTPGGVRTTSRVCQAAPQAATEAVGTTALSANGQLPPMGVDMIINLLRAIRIPTQIELNNEKLTPGSTFGDPMLRTTRVARESFDAKNDAAVEAFLARTIALLSAAMWALQGLTEAQKSALPLVEVGRVLRQAEPAIAGAAEVSARIGLLPCIAAAFTAAVTTMGLATFGAHAAACAPMWKHATAPGLAWDSSGRPQPVNFFWGTISRMAAMDEAALIPTALYRAPTTTDDALAPISGIAQIRAHGADASILAFAARLGLLRAARLDSTSHAPLATLWSAYHGALMAAAEASRKECRTLLGPSVVAHVVAQATRAPTAAAAATMATGGRAHGHSGSQSAGRGRFGDRGPPACPHCKKHHKGPCWHQADNKPPQ